MLIRLEGIFGLLYSQSHSTFIIITIFIKDSFIGICIVVVKFLFSVFDVASEIIRIPITKTSVQAHTHLVLLDFHGNSGCANTYLAPSFWLCSKFVTQKLYYSPFCS